MPLCGRAIGLLTALAVRPAADGTVNMRENNWELALDASAGMGQSYAADRRIVYLSRWEFGIGISANGSEIPEWINERDCTPDRLYRVAAQIDIHEVFRIALDNGAIQPEM
jgi:hypothetical protein